MAAQSLRLAATPVSRLGASRSELSSLCRLGRSPSAQPSLPSCCVSGANSQHQASKALPGRRLSQGQLLDAVAQPLAGRRQRRHAHTGTVSSSRGGDACGSWVRVRGDGHWDRTTSTTWWVAKVESARRASPRLSPSKFANAGQPTLVVSTDPAHSLSDSFAQVRASTSGVSHSRESSRAKGTEEITGRSNPSSCYLRLQEEGTGGSACLQSQTPGVC